MNSTSLGSPNPLAVFGPNKVGTFNVGQGDVVGTFQNGGVYQSIRTNTTPAPFASDPDGDGQVNFGHNYHYAVPGTGTTLNGSTIDLVSVMIHELGHGLGLLSFADPGTPTGVKDQSNLIQSPDLMAVLAATVRTLQEAQERIEKLEARVAELESVC